MRVGDLDNVILAFETKIFLWNGKSKVRVEIRFETGQEAYVKSVLYRGCVAVVRRWGKQEEEKMATYMSGNRSSTNWMVIADFPENKKIMKPKTNMAKICLVKREKDSKWRGNIHKTHQQQGPQAWWSFESSLVVVVSLEASQKNASDKRLEDRI